MKVPPYKPSYSSTSIKKNNRNNDEDYSFNEDYSNKESLLSRNTEPASSSIPIINSETTTKRKYFLPFGWGGLDAAGKDLEKNLANMNSKEVEEVADILHGGGFYNLINEDGIVRINRYDPKVPKQITLSFEPERLAWLENKLNQSSPEVAKVVVAALNTPDEKYKRYQITQNPEDRTFSVKPPYSDPFYTSSEFTRAVQEAEEAFQKWAATGSSADNKINVEKWATVDRMRKEHKNQTSQSVANNRIEQSSDYNAPIVNDGVPVVPPGTRLVDA